MYYMFLTHELHQYSRHGHKRDVCTISVSKKFLADIGYQIEPVHDILGL